MWHSGDASSVVGLILFSALSASVAAVLLTGSCLLYLPPRRQLQRFWLCLRLSSTLLGLNAVYLHLYRRAHSALTPPSPHTPTPEPPRYPFNDPR